MVSGKDCLKYRRKDDMNPKEFSKGLTENYLDGIPSHKILEKGFSFDDDTVCRGCLLTFHMEGCSHCGGAEISREILRQTC